MSYNSKYTGAQVEEAIDKINDLESKVNDLESNIGTGSVYELLVNRTFTEDVDTFSVIDLVPDITSYKDFIVILQFKYDDTNTNRTGYIHFNNYITHPFNSVRLEKIINASYKTHYILRIHIGDSFDKTAYLESHTNSFGNYQYADGNQGLNLFCLLDSTTYLTFNNFLFAFAFKANEIIKIYGKK